MSLSIGIVGLPNVGKSTLFNALTEKSVSAENFPFCTIDPSVGIVAVPDDRIDKLSSFSNSAKKISAVIEFVDIAGLVKGAHEGEGLGNKFLTHIREVDVIAEVVRIFDDEDVVHVNGRVEPRDDVEIINLELVMADFGTVSKRLSNLEKLTRTGDKELLKEKAVCEKLLPVLEGGKLASSLELEDDELKIAKVLNLLTLKPILYVLNRKNGAVNLDEIKDDRWQRLLDLFKDTNSKFVVVDAGTEEELSSVSGEEKSQFRKEFGVLDDGVNDLIKTGYKLLELITFFTTGEDETRAWQITRGSTAPEAGTAIHSDFQDKFIRAEIIACQKLLEAGSFATAREKGWVKTEGKEYIVQDGDVVEFKI